MSPETQPDRAPCPHLPQAGTDLRAADLKRFGRDRGPDFYRACLEGAQSLWRRGLPAQTVLLLNRAFASALAEEDPVLGSHPLPYAAMLWILRAVRPGDFIGNPRRHFQHLATRMVEPRRDLRAARAWACWAYACRIFPGLPADQRQLLEEGIAEPGLETIRARLEALGLAGEAALWESLLPGALPHPAAEALAAAGSH